MILAIDTSTRQAGVALVERGHTMAELTWDVDLGHSHVLTDTIDTSLGLAGRSVGQIGAIAVAIGPGSFSGLRVGISEGKGLALAIDAPIVGVSTLDAIALQAICLSPEVWAVLPAGRGQVYTAQYEGDWHTFHRATDYMILDMAEAARRAHGVVAGEAAHEVVDAQRGEGTWIPPEPWRLRRPSFLAELGNRYLEAGGQDQRNSLEPLYLRRSAAEEKRMGTSH
jgi:tRNA threonylcarbamoyladenosine biosynthesis protein TsaB